MKKNKMNSGQSLLEVLAALGAATLVVTSIVVVIVNALNNTQYSKSQNLATQYAQEGMEIIRKMRDSDYGAYSALTNRFYCLDKNDIFLSNVPGPSDDRKGAFPVGCQRQGGGVNLNVDFIFAREIEFNTSGACTTGKETIVRVSWADGKCSTSGLCHKVELRSCFTDFNVIPTP